MYIYIVYLYYRNSIWKYTKKLLGIPGYIIITFGIIFGILTLLFVIRYICIVYIIHLHVNNKVPTSAFIPSFITKWIAQYEYVQDFKDNKERLSWEIEFFYKHLYIFLFTSFLCFSLAFIF